MTSQPAERRRRMRLMLVDDHDVVRRGVRSLIEAIPDWIICAESPENDEALKLAAETRPDIVVMEIARSDLSGAGLLENIKHILPKAEMLVLTSTECERSIVHALRAGARGYVLKSENARRIIDALSALSRHQPYFSASVSQNLLDFYLHARHTSGDQLAPRERQVVKLVAEGNTNKRISVILALSIKTVETYRVAAMRKIGAKSSADIARYALRNELVQL
jgi:DNA-binding NarL/FixJ family response regulator